MRRIFNLSLYLYEHRIVRFLFSGGMATGTNIGGLFLLVHVFHLYYLLASVISFTTAVFVSFTLQKFFTFNDQNRASLRKQAVLYFGFQLFNLGVNTFFMYVGVDLLRIHYLIVQSLIIVVMTTYNFFVYKHLVFNPDAV